MPILPKRSGVEVFVNTLGTITLRQADDSMDEASIDEAEPMLVVHPDDVSTLMRALDRAKREARKVAVDDHEDVTVPEPYARWRSGSA